MREAARARIQAAEATGPAKAAMDPELAQAIPTRRGGGGAGRAAAAGSAAAGGRAGGGGAAGAGGGGLGGGGGVGVGAEEAAPGAAEPENALGVGGGGGVRVPPHGAQGIQRVLAEHRGDGGGDRGGLGLV